MSTTDPQVLIVSRPVNDATDVYVIRYTEEGDRQALVADLSTYLPEEPVGPGWFPVATGDEAPIIGRLAGAVGVDLAELQSILDSAQQQTAAAAAP
jgi:hypothetical protein